MKGKLALIVVLALMFMIETLTVAMSTSTADVFGFAKPDEILAPGEIGQPITISITNLGPSLFNVSVIPLSVYPFTPYSILTILTISQFPT
ncbi:hypothetical protein [Sulfuracidifex metallicus]|uniref:hypothetical protein n=1 Tax=Sulfuracidifex metallicus TaxID=47303 RepID=UPI0006D14C53|nr:hypothetical protein [Sulfuracidifex metallicus]